MRFTVLAACVLLCGSNVFSAGSVKRTPKTPTKARKASAPTSDAVDAYHSGAKLDTITEYHNELGQKVYSIAASHFDVSPPLLELAMDAPEQAAESEPPAEPLAPPWRMIRSDVPDPVVQSVIPPAGLFGPGDLPPVAPTVGFNFAGVPSQGPAPSDSNGSVGNNQFVETVNLKFQVWSLNRSTQSATSILGPVSTNTLWAGLGGPCEAQNSGDPIVVFDKTAKRWLISQLTTSPAAGLYYQCVAVSTTADATGAYARYAFAVPDGLLGDYPKISVWSSAYFMTAHGFTGGSLLSHPIALFAAMDRTKMLLGNPAATWQVIEDPDEFGHLPADLDGFAQPPSLAPGIFVSLSIDGMRIHRMKVNFTNPAGTVKTLQAIVPLAPSTAACITGACIPQPGTLQKLDALGSLLMFRAAYRNFIDHESLVVSHSVDPSISGVASGVRWYDIRISGNPDATCPIYPCLYQQGTIADLPDGRSRWIPSIAMDTAENILLGYNASGKTNGSENHSARYTGRAKGDPAGLMTVPETTIVNGTANNVSFSRWGDYSSMSVDPFDDCTFWYVSQHNTATNSWSTRVASAAFPAGTAAGQCPPTTCDTRPFAIPSGVSAGVPGDNQITVSWTGVTPAPGAYAIERADGPCQTAGLYKPLAATTGATTTFTDTTVQGGLTYSYRVRTAADAAGKCQALLAAACVNATATGSCNVKPTFAGAANATSNQTSNCGTTLTWTPGTSGCPLTPSLRYNIFRGPTPDFIPSPANRIATCVSSSSHVDTVDLSSGTTFYYVVRAEDGSTGNGGECGGGNEESNNVVAAATPYGAGTQSTPVTWTDGGGDGTGSLLLNVLDTGDTNTPVWRFATTSDDPGANHTPGGGYAYRNAGPAAGNNYRGSVCAESRTPILKVGAASVTLTYWERHQFEYQYDGVGVDYSVNGGSWTDIPAPSNNAEGCSASDTTGDWIPMGCVGNACGYRIQKSAFSGPLAAGAGMTCSDYPNTGPVTAYSHRCHLVTGLTPGDTVQFRWRTSSDFAIDFAGFYLDDIAVTNIRPPNACVPDTCSSQADGTACDDGDPCTSGDACGGGVCTAGSPPPLPAETEAMSAEADKATIDWSATALATHYALVRGHLGAFPVGPGGGDEVCFTNLPGPSFVDPALPAAGGGFWYLSRGENACGAGPYGSQSNGAPRVTTTCP